MTDQPTGGEAGTRSSGDGNRDRVRLSDFAGVDPSGATTSPRHTASVQAAIDQVARRGGVLVWDGAYPCTSPWMLPSHTRIEGAGDGRSRAIGTWTAEPEGPGVFRNAEFDGTATDIHVDGLEIVGPHDGSPWGDTATSGRPAHGIRLYQVSDVSVTRCRIHHVAGMGINHQGCRQFHFDDNEVFSLGRDGITGYYAAGTNMFDGTVNRNRIWEVGDDGVAFWGTQRREANGVTTRVTTTHGQARVDVVDPGAGPGFTPGHVGSSIAIAGAGAAGNVHEATITAWLSERSVAISPVPVAGALAADATVGFTRPHGLEASHNVIVSRRARHPRMLGRGMVVAACEDVVLDHNQVTSTYGDGILVRDSPDDPNIYARSCLVADANTIEDAGQVGGGDIRLPRHGVELMGTRDCTIGSVTVRRAFDADVFVVRSVDYTVAGRRRPRTGSAPPAAGTRF